MGSLLMAAIWLQPMRTQRREMEEKTWRVHILVNRFQLAGGGLGPLSTQISHLHPYNGFLLWVITAHCPCCSLFSRHFLCPDALN